MDNDIIPIPSEIDEIVKCYEHFLKIVKQISMSAEEQIIKLKGTVVTDEIALDYVEIGMNYARKLLSNKWITQEQFQHAENIEKKLEQMTQKKELWNDDALLHAVEWEELRKKGRELLHILDA